jgi:hypothetical protein
MARKAILQGVKMNNSSQDMYGLYFGLLKSFQCLQDEIQRFRENGSHSETEELLWNQCLIRSQEVEKCREKLPEDIVDLIKTHVMRSRFVKFLDQGRSHGIF